MRFARLSRVLHPVFILCLRLYERWSLWFDLSINKVLICYLLRIGTVSNNVSRINECLFVLSIFLGRFLLLFYQPSLKSFCLNHFLYIKSHWIPIVLSKSSKLKLFFWFLCWRLLFDTVASSYKSTLALVIAVSCWCSFRSILLWHVYLACSSCT